MNDIVLRVNKLGKQYHIGAARARHDTLRDMLTEAMFAPFQRVARLLRGEAAAASGLYEDFWAVKEVSFEVERGEVVGVIGPNGAGKSTLLKMLARIAEPTEGYADVRGRVGSLLEVGTGFHPELTGRENIYLNGAILGMQKHLIDRRFDEIVAFAETERFVDTPVKHYSSGMYLRLAFSVAAHLEPEILLVDEVLSVGDAVFQKKCLGKMGDVASEGRTVIFVSHNMGAIVRLCDRALWLENGRLRRDYKAAEVVATYLQSTVGGTSTWARSTSNPRGKIIAVNAARILSASQNPTSVVDFAHDFIVEIRYQLLERTKGLSILCRLIDAVGNIVWTSWDTDGCRFASGVRDPGYYVSECRVNGALLKPGRYLVSVGSLGADGSKVLNYHENVISFDVSEVGYPLNLNRLGIITPVFEWRVKELEGSVVNERPWATH